MTPFLPALLGYLLLFAALYAGFGVQSPYLPSLLQAHGLYRELFALQFGEVERPPDEAQPSLAAVGGTADPSAR